MLGQIATFMDSLHLTYDEVLDKIPYRNLLIMAKDKIRVAYGDVYREMSEEEERAFIAAKKKETNK